MRSLVAAALLAAPAVAAPLDPLAPAKVELARTDVKNLSAAAEAYKAKVGHYPAKVADLVAAGYVKPPPGKELVDPWGNPYRIDPKGGRNDGKKADIWTVAPDMTEIGNWPAKK